MAAETESARPGQWRQDPRVASALITSLFGLLGTVVTILAVRDDSPSEPPTSPSSAAAAQAAPRPPGETAAFGSFPEAPGPNLLLNFAAFQSRLATSSVTDDQRQAILRPLLGHRVAWKGYVDAVTPLQSPTPDAAITVALVESRDKLTQTAFKAPAYFRCGPRAIDAVSQLVPGDVVSFTGILKSHSLLGAEVVDAQLLTINGLPAAQTAAEPEVHRTH